MNKLAILISLTAVVIAIPEAKPTPAKSEPAAVVPEPTPDIGSPPDTAATSAVPEALPAEAAPVSTPAPADVGPIAAPAGVCPALTPGRDVKQGLAASYPKPSDELHPGSRQQPAAAPQQYAAYERRPVYGRFGRQRGWQTVRVR